MKKTRSKYSVISLYLFLAVVALTATFFSFIYARFGYRTLVRTEAESRIVFQQRMLETYLTEVAGDSLFLAETPLIDEEMHGPRNEDLRTALDLLLTSKPRYRSITYFNHRGIPEVSVGSSGHPADSVPLPVDKLQQLRLLESRDLLIELAGTGSSALWREPLESPLVYFWIPVAAKDSAGERLFLRIIVDFKALAVLLTPDNGSTSFLYFLFSSEGKAVALNGGLRLPAVPALQAMMRSEANSRWFDGNLIASRRFNFSGIRDIGSINVISDLYTLVAVLPGKVHATAVRSLLLHHLAWLITALLVLSPLVMLFAGYRRRQEEAESQLDENMRFQSAVMQALPDTILRIDPNGRVEAVQTNLDSFRMFRHKDFPARVEDIFPEELAYKIGYFVRQVLEQQHELWFEYRFEERGADFFFDFRFVYSSDEEVILILRNKTEEKEQKRRLYTTNLFLDAYKSAMDATSLVAKTDRQGRLIFMNEHFRVRFGQSYTHAVGRDLIELMSPKIDPDSNINGDDPLDRLMVLSGIVECRGTSGESYYIDNTLLPISDESGRVQEVISFGHDVTELENALAVAREAENIRSAFIARMSHEMRTPLNCIIGFGEVVTESDDITMARHYGSMILSESGTLLDLVNQVLDLSKIEAGKLSILMKPFDLHSLLNSIVESNMVLARKKGLYLRLKQGSGTPRYLIGDTVRLRQILNNLLGNAVKFTNIGGVELVVRNETGIPGVHQLRFEIHDTGIGIPNDQQPHVFDSFFQVDAGDTRRYGGTGLGTTIARQLIELMGGEISFTSIAGEGSQFWFVLDMEESSIVPENRESDAPDAGPQLDLTGINILIAEDYEPNLEVLRLFLRSTGARIIAVENGQEAVEAYRTAKIDLILMDIHMPLLDGYEATTRIRSLEGSQQNDRVPIVGVTADAFRNDINRCFDVGMNQVLIKPLRRRRLLLALAEELKIKFEPGGGEERVDTSNDENDPMNFNALLAEVEGDRAVASQLARGYMDALTAQIPVMEQALEDADWSRLHREAHSAKGGAANLFAEKLRETALKLEQSAKAGKSGQAGRSLAPFLEETERLRRYLEGALQLSEFLPGGMESADRHSN